MISHVGTLKDPVFQGLLASWGVPLASWKQNQKDGATCSPSSSVASSTPVASPAVLDSKDGAGAYYICLQTRLYPSELRFKS